MHKNLPNGSTAQLAKQTDFDIYRRSLPIMPSYIVLWIAIAGLSKFYQAHPSLSLLIAGSLSAVVVAHLLFTLASRWLLEASPITWRFFFYGFTFAGCTIWSGVFTLCFFEPEFDVIFLPMVLATAGLTNAALSSLAPSRWVALSYVSIMILPAVFVCFTSMEHVTLGMTVVAYWFYGLIILQRFHGEYRSGFEKENTFVQQHTELQRQNRTDGLTHVMNRRFFDEAIVREWQQGADEGTWLALLFIDIDFFKKINDTYGHMAGDECLIQAAAIINGAVQSGRDIVSRYGGEEFAVLLPNTAPDMAERIAESIRRQFSLMDFCFDQHCIKVTASIGVSAVVPNINLEPSVLIDQADQGVYLAKEAGRNNVKRFGARR
ncbi:MAG: GGDEF domain-containing protein [Marinagarivorans sp.]|nr:GGDEF domain-containing protein [Marinagarivorans sp.]